MAVVARPSTAADRRAALAGAIRSAYQDEARITQDELAERIGGSVTQGMVSRWARGAVVPDLDTIAAIEEACGVKPGYVLRLAGYVDDQLGVADAIRIDSNLNAIGRKVVLAFYEFEVSRSRAASDDTNPDADDRATKKSVIR